MKKRILLLLVMCFVVCKSIHAQQDTTEKNSSNSPVGMIVGISISIILFIVYSAIKKRISKKKNASFKEVDTKIPIQQISREDKRKEEKRLQREQWKIELEKDDITIDRANEIYERLDDKDELCPIAKEILRKMTNELLKNENLSVEQLEHIRDTYVFGDSPEEKVVEEKIQKLALIEALRGLEEIKVHKDDEDALIKIYNDSDNESIVYYRAIEYISKLYLIQIKDAEDKLYGNTFLSEEERTILIKLVDKIAESDIDCAAKTIADDIMSDDYGHSNLIEQEILSPDTTLQRLQEIEDKESLADDVNEILQENLHEATLARLLVIKDLMQQEGLSDDDKETYIDEIEEMLKYVSSESSAELLGNILSNN